MARDSSRSRSRLEAVGPKRRRAIREQALTIAEQRSRAQKSDTGKGMMRRVGAVVGPQQAGLAVDEAARQQGENKRKHRDSALREGGKPPAPNTPPSKLVSAIAGQRLPGQQPRVNPATGGTRAPVFQPRKVGPVTTLPVRQRPVTPLPLIRRDPGDNVVQMPTRRPGRQQPPVVGGGGSVGSLIARQRAKQSAPRRTRR